MVKSLRIISWLLVEETPSSSVGESRYLSFFHVAAYLTGLFIRHNLFVHLWKGHKNHEGLIENPLVSFGANEDIDEARASNFNWEFQVEPKTVMEYITQVLAWKRLCMLEDAGDGFSGSDYWQNNVYCFDVLKEDWAAEGEIGYDGENLFNLLTLSRDGDKASEQYLEAEKMVWRLLTQASMQKVTHGKGLIKGVSLGTLLDRPENEGIDRAPGTFMELLRYGAVHFRQKRESIVQMQTQKAAHTIKKGLLEA